MGRNRNLHPSIWREVDYKDHHLHRRGFDKTRTPLTTWFDIAWHLTTAKNGLSAKTIEQTLGVSYRTAWAILQRFRVAMVRS